MTGIASRRLRSVVWMAIAGATGCAESPSSSAAPDAGLPADESPVCVGKCDGVDQPEVQTDYTVDLAKASAIWGGTPVARIGDLYSVQITLPNGLHIHAATHMFGQPVVPVPYHDDDGDHVVDAKGQVVFQGDREVSRFFRPGEIGYAIKHHRPERRALDFGALAGGASADDLKEDMKLQDTHIELVVGVRRPLGPDGQLVDGVVTLNNPQNYQDGRFGNEHYSMVFVKPAFPDYVPATAVAGFRDNIRTMMLGFNAVSEFPGDYNGGDPLAASTPEKVREHVRNMVLAVAGEGDAQTEARAFFTRQENLIYCAELAHVSTSAGLLVPLNRAGLVDSGLVSEDVFARFGQLVADHNNRLSTPFTELNANPQAAHVEGTMAPADLRALPSYGSAEEATKLAFRPLTMAEIVEGFLSTHIPRKEAALGGEALAPVQAAVLQAMKPGLYEAMGMDDSLYQSMAQNAQESIASLQEDLADPALSDVRRTETQEAITEQQRLLGEAQAQLAAVQQKRVIVEQTFNEVVQIVGTSYGSYEEFRTAVAPAIAKARALTGPRDASGVGYFVPPSALHLVALANCDGDTRCGGLIGLDYVGHGIHLSAVGLNQAPPAPPAAPIVSIAEVVPRPNVDFDGNGTLDVRGDEYVTLVNTGTAPADLAGWTLADNVDTRHEFPDGTILAPGASLTVHGSTTVGGLGLNDNGDTLTLNSLDGVVAQVAWGRIAVGAVVTGTESTH